MSEKVSILIFMLVLSLVLVSSPQSLVVKAEPKTIVVPDDYTSIADAIGNATYADVIFVKSGTYNETLLIEKRISLIGEDPKTTVINGVGPVIVLRHDDVTISGFTIKNAYRGDAEYHTNVHLLHANNCNISQNNLVNGGCGVWLYDASNNIIIKNTISNFIYGIRVQSSKRNAICNNDITLSKCIIPTYGISIQSSNENIICNNTVSGGNNGIIITSSSNCTFEDNKISNNEINFELSGSEPLHYLNNFVDMSNTIDGKAILYWIDEHDRTVPLDAGSVYLVNCSKITVQKLSISETGTGINLVHCNSSNILDNVPLSSKSTVSLKNSNHIMLQNNSLSISLFDSSFNEIISNQGKISLTYANNNTIAKNTITSDDWGLVLKKSYFNEIFKNCITKNSRDALYIYESEKNNIYNNDIFDNLAGILIVYASQNTISNNNIRNNQGQVITISVGTNNIITKNRITNNYSGIRIHESSKNNVTENLIMHNSVAGIAFSSSEANNVLQNLIVNNSIGILFGTLSSENKIINNTIKENTGYGILISLVRGGNDIIYSNNVINNTIPVFINSTLHVPSNIGKVNTWNNGSVGNYWSDYSGTDITGDGIGDTGYRIDENNVDNLPLMNPVEIEFTTEFPSGPTPVFEERRFQVHDTHDFYYVTIVSNSTVSDFDFRYSVMRVSFYVNGTAWTTGLCNVSIPAEFMSIEFSVFKDEKPLLKNTDYTQTFNGTHYLFTITYDHSSHLIQIYANNNIPEFPSGFIFVIFGVVGLAVFVAKKRWRQI